MERVTVAGETFELTDAQAKEFYRLAEQGIPLVKALEIATFEEGDLLVEEPGDAPEL